MALMNDTLLETSAVFVGPVGSEGGRSPSTLPTGQASTTWRTGAGTTLERWAQARSGASSAAWRISGKSVAGTRCAIVPTGALARARAIGDRRIVAGTRGRCRERGTGRGDEADRRAHNGE